MLSSWCFFKADPYFLRDGFFPLFWVKSGSFHSSFFALSFAHRNPFRLPQVNSATYFFLLSFRFPNHRRLLCLFSLTEKTFLLLKSFPRDFERDFWLASFTQRAHSFSAFFPFPVEAFFRLASSSQIWRRASFGLSFFTTGETKTFSPLLFTSNFFPAATAWILPEARAPFSLRMSYVLCHPVPALFFL